MVTNGLEKVLDLLSAELGALFHIDEPLGARTTYRVGGCAAGLVEVESEEVLVAVHRSLTGTGSAIPIFVIGNGSNVLVADEGFPGLALVLGKAFETVDFDGTQVNAGAAIGMPVVARRSASAGLSGLEWAVGVPGTIGGGVRMNAGGHGSDIASTLIEARVFDLVSGIGESKTKEQLHLAYRSSAVGPRDVVLLGVFGLERGDPAQSRSRIDEIVRWRRENQPGGPNAGSVFANPEGRSAGALIDAAGLKGMRIGSAQVSTKHANFIQADAGGSANDVRRLIEHVHGEVRATTGIDLRTELKMIGFPTDEQTVIFADRQDKSPLDVPQTDVPEASGKPANEPGR